MGNRLQVLRSSVAARRPTAGARLAGEVYVNFADGVFGYIDAAGTPVDVGWSDTRARIILLESEVAALESDVTALETNAVIKNPAAGVTQTITIGDTVQAGLRITPKGKGQRWLDFRNETSGIGVNFLYNTSGIFELQVANAITGWLSSGALTITNGGCTTFHATGGTYSGRAAFGMMTTGSVLKGELSHISASDTVRLLHSASNARMEIDSTGFYFIGKPVSVTDLYITAAPSVATVGQDLYIRNAAGATQWQVIRITSLAEYKTDVATIQDPLADLMALRPVNFRSTIEGEDPDRLHRGFVAEEVWAASETFYAEGFYDKNAILATAVAVIQGLTRRIEALEAAKAA